MNYILGILTLFLYALNAIIMSLSIIILALFKIIRIRLLSSWSTVLIEKCADIWVTINGIIDDLLLPTKLKVSFDKELNLHMEQWYMIIANHQSWVDILILQKFFHKKIPFLIFFLKKELIYVPLFGVAWYILGFPFMHRYNIRQLKRNPILRIKDINAIKNVCAKFKTKPTSLINFVEGTRFTKTKHSEQNSPFIHLLRPKAAGLATALNFLDDEFKTILDVSIFYPDKIPSFLDYVFGSIKEVKIHIRQIPVSKEFLGNYIEDKKFKLQFQHNLQSLWQTKDLQLQKFAQKENLTCHHQN